MGRDVTSSEVEYWYAIDSGEKLIPPRPCRYCGQVWVHLEDCVTEMIRRKKKITVKLCNEKFAISDTFTPSKYSFSCQNEEGHDDPHMDYYLDGRFIWPNKVAVSQNNEDYVSYENTDKSDTAMPMFATYRPRVDRTYRARQREGDVYNDLNLADWIATETDNRTLAKVVFRNSSHSLKTTSELSVRDDQKRLMVTVGVGDWVVINEKNLVTIKTDEQFKHLYTENMM